MTYVIIYLSDHGPRLLRRKLGFIKKVFSSLLSLSSQPPQQWESKYLHVFLWKHGCDRGLKDAVEVDFC